MAKAYFFFNGGPYKVDIDNGRDRVPLTPTEAEVIFVDPELLSETGTGAGTEINLANFADVMSTIEAGDELFVGLLPDAAFYRGIWLHAYNAVKGFQVEASLVPVKDVYAAFEAGDATGVAELAGSAVLPFNFDDGVCHATCDAIQLNQLNGTDYNVLRNNAGQVGEAFDPVFVGLGTSLYIRIKIVAKGDLGTEAGKCCGKCNKDSYPSFKVGAILDTTCADKQRIYRACCGVDGKCGQCGDC